MRILIVSTSVTFLLTYYTVKAFPLDIDNPGKELQTEERNQDDIEDLKVIESYLFRENQKYLEKQKDIEAQKYAESSKFEENQNDIENQIDKINKQYTENQKDKEVEVNLFDIESEEETEKQKYTENEKGSDGNRKGQVKIEQQNDRVIKKIKESKNYQNNKENQKEIEKQNDTENTKDKESNENQNDSKKQKEIEKPNNTLNKKDRESKENITNSDNKKEIKKHNDSENRNATISKLGKVNVTNVDTAIEFLQKEQSEVYQQINEAIEESVKALQRTNDTYAQEGISYVQELKDQISELNFTGDIDDIQHNLKDIQDYFSRRMGYNRSEDIEDRRQLKYDEFEEREFRLDKVFGKPKDSPKWLTRYQNRLLVQDQINSWMVEREQEKTRIKEYHEQHSHTLKPERCPREGRIKQRKQKKKPNEQKAKAKVKHAGVYPCCRKCCKRSDMGCL